MVQDSKLEKCSPAEQKQAGDQFAECRQEAFGARDNVALDKVLADSFGVYIGTNGFKLNSIYRDLPAQYLRANGKDDLQTIARKSLPADASQSERFARVLEIQSAYMIAEKLSEIAGSFVPKENSQVFLPGHRKDGAVIFEDSRGTSYEIARDQSIKANFADGRGYLQTNNPDGSYKRNYFGFAEKIEFEVGKDGKTKHSSLSEEPALVLSEQKSRFAAILKSSSSSEQNTEDLLQSATVMETRLRESKVEEGEIARTYKQLGRLISGGAALNSDERRVLVKATLDSVARPQSNDQGHNLVCELTATLNRNFSDRPSFLISKLADLSSKAETFLEDGTLVHLDPSQLHPHGDSKRYKEPGVNVRNYANELLDTLAFEGQYRKQLESDFPFRERRYFQLDSEGADDFGHRVYAYNGKDQTLLSKKPGDVNAPQIEYQLAGIEREDGFVRFRGTSSAPGVREIKSEAELTELLEKLKNKDELQSGLIVELSDLSPLFSKFQSPDTPFDGKPDPSAFAVNHAVRVLDYDKEKGLLRIDNQWGDDADYLTTPVPVKELFESMQGPKIDSVLDKLESMQSRMSREVFAAWLNAVLDSYVSKYMGEAIDKFPHRDDPAAAISRIAKLSSSAPAEQKAMLDEKLKAASEIMQQAQ